LREYLEEPGEPGTYRWDFFAGYDDEGVSGLVNHPDLQEKVRRVVTQGFIDPEDFNGVSETLIAVLKACGVMTDVYDRIRR
jgi:hypothetical protein